MKALSFRQPWAWALFNGKDVDNRVWKTKFKGRIYVHASKTLDMTALEWLTKKQGDFGIQIPLTHEFILGAIIGEIDIVNCVIDYESLWFTGPYGFVLANPVKYEVPIPCRGYQRYFEPKEVST